MGTWKYQDPKLGTVPAVGYSYARMVGLLTDPLCGWPSNRLLQVENEDGPGTLAYRLIAQFEAVEDVALFYYVGHGQIDPDNQLCLGLGYSQTEPRHRAVTSLPFQAVRKALIESPAHTKIVILDCCFSGLAGQRSNTLAAEVLDPAAGAGAYTMMASEAYNEAWYEADSSIGRPQTYFTKYLADLVEAGMPGHPSALRVHTLFGQLRENLARDKLPAPAVRNVDAAHEFLFAYNAAALSSRFDPERAFRPTGNLAGPGREPAVPARGRWGRRLLPLAAGYDPSAPPATGRFLPTSVDEMTARRVIERLAKELPGYSERDKRSSLDDLIDALAAEWIADVREQHAHYVASVSPMVQAAEAEARYSERLAARDRSMLAHKVMALESAMVIELVLRTATYDIVLVVALGFTVGALYLAHTCGVLFRDRMAGAADVSRITPYLCLAVWLFLGVTAFLIRLDVFSSYYASFSFSLSGPSSSLPLSIQPAILFLALYLATGLAAGIGAYSWRNPSLDSYARAARAYRKAHQQADMSFSRASSADARLNILRTELAAADKTLEREISSRLALAEMLKQIAPTMITPRPRDDSGTDIQPDGEQAADYGGRE